MTVLSYTLGAALLALGALGVVLFQVGSRQARYQARRALLLTSLISIILGILALITGWRMIIPAWVGPTIAVVAVGNLAWLAASCWHHRDRRAEST